MSLAENKTIVVIADASDQAPEQYYELTMALEAAGAGTPRGRLYHIVCAKGKGYTVTDVWESVELFNQFAVILVSTIIQLGGTPAPFQIYPVIKLVTG